jgi:hypothetical protein
MFLFLFPFFLSHCECCVCVQEQEAADTPAVANGLAVTTHAKPPALPHGAKVQGMTARVFKPNKHPRDPLKGDVPRISSIIHRLQLVPAHVKQYQALQRHGAVQASSSEALEDTRVRQLRQFAWEGRVVEEVAKGSHEMGYLTRPSTVPDRLPLCKQQVSGSMRAQTPAASVRRLASSFCAASTTLSHTHILCTTDNSHLLHHSHSQCCRMQRTPEKCPSSHISAPATRHSTSTIAALSPLRPASCNPPIVRSRVRPVCQPQSTVLEPSILHPAEALWQTVAATAAWNRGGGGFDEMREPEFLQAANTIDTLAELSAAVHAAHAYGAPAVMALQQGEQQLGWAPAAGHCSSARRGGVHVSEAPVHLLPRQARDNVLRGLDPSRAGGRNALRSAFGQARPPRAAAPVAAFRAPAAACGVGRGSGGP